MDGFSGFLAALEVRKRSRPKGSSSVVCRLGEVVGRVMEPLKTAHDETSQAEMEWAQVVPTHVAGHCRIQGIDKGQLHVVVDSPVYAYELRTCSVDLLKDMRRRCPGLGVRKIKVTLA